MTEVLHEYRYGNKTKRITKIYGLRQYCSKNGISFLDFITQKYDLEYLVWNKLIKDYHCKLCKKELSIKIFDFENKKIEFIPCKCCIPDDSHPSIIIKDILYSCFDEIEVDEIYDEYKKKKMRNWTTAGIDVASKEAFIKRYGEEIGVERFRKSREFNTTKLDYWMRETNGNEEEAKILLKERQTTFSLDKCVKKYGEEGYKIWQKRQDKWQETLCSKSVEEIEIINYKKVINGKASKISQDLFCKLNESDACFHSQYGEFGIRLNSNRIVYPDFILGNRIIEFYGDFWHANPNNHNGEDYVRNISKTSIPRKAKDIWQKDKERISQLEELGYKVMIVWENDYRKEPKRIIKQCKDFLCN
jgi:G:T-mismatch repair DNA endonuclease (very short patch repair protein)